MQVVRFKTNNDQENVQTVFCWPHQTWNDLSHGSQHVSTTSRLARFQQLRRPPRFYKTVSISAISMVFRLLKYAFQTIFQTWGLVRKKQLHTYCHLGRHRKMSTHKEPACLLVYIYPHVLHSQLLLKLPSNLNRLVTPITANLWH